MKQSKMDEWLKETPSAHKLPERIKDKPKSVEDLVAIRKKKFGV